MTCDNVTGPQCLSGHKVSSSQLVPVGTHSHVSRLLMIQLMPRVFCSSHLLLPDVAGDADPDGGDHWSKYLGVCN